MLGMTVVRNRGAGVIKLGRRMYMFDMHERFNMMDC
jgi:hypothetical protein